MSSNEKFSNALGDRKEAVGTTLLAENKSVTKDAEKGSDKLSDTLFSEKKSSAKDVEKGSDELVDTLLYENKSVIEKDKRSLINWQIHCCLRRKHQQRKQQINQQRKWRKVLMKRQIRNYLRINP